MRVENHEIRRGTDTEAASRHAMNRLKAAGRVGRHGLLDRDRLARIDHAAVGKPALDRHADVAQRIERPARIVR